MKPVFDVGLVDMIQILAVRKYSLLDGKDRYHNPSKFILYFTNWRGRAAQVWHLRR